MRCPRCGSNNIDGSTSCAQCGAPFVQAPTLRNESRGESGRKTVQMSSYRSANRQGSRAEEHVENDRPWEVRVPSRKQQSAQAKRASGRTPTSSVRQVSRGDTHGGGKTAGVAGSAGAAAASTAGSNTEVIKLKTPTPRKASKGLQKSSGKGNGNGKGAIGAIVAVLLIGCIGAGIWFFTQNGNNTNIVSFDTNGGTAMSQRSIVENGQLQQPTPPVRNGYVFEGWYKDAAYTQPAEFPLTITENITLYAKWSPVQDGASAGVSSSSSTSSSSAASSSAAGVTGGGVPSSITYGGGSDVSGGGSSGASSDGGYSSGGNAGSASGGGSDSGTESGGGASGSGEGSASGESEAGTTTADISVVASDGSALSGSVRLTDGFVIPDSSEHAYSIDELRALGLSDAELCVAWNEPFARLGNDFDSPGLQGYFDNRSWYSNGFRKISLEPGSAAETTVTNLQALAQENPSSAAWLDLRTY